MSLVISPPGQHRGAQARVSQFTGMLMMRH
jgi:hypothetical protein